MGTDLKGAALDYWKETESLKLKHVKTEFVK
jgi:hypothetical protein